MSTPYIDTELEGIAYLHPSKMDNYVYINLKENLKERYEGKCFRDYGYVDKIYEIKSYKAGKIYPENPISAATFEVVFSCRIYIPVKNAKIVCKVEKITRTMLSAMNGPIRVGIQFTGDGSETFSIDNMNRIVYKKDNKLQQLKHGDYIITSIYNYSIQNGDNVITARGLLLDMASETDIKNYYTELHK